MSETDSFIQEVTEEVRQDRMFALWKKYGAYVIGAVVVIVGAAAAWSWKIDQERKAAEARGALLIHADTTKVEETTALPGKIDGPGKLVAELTAAVALEKAKRTTEAGKLYAEIARRAGLAPEYADLATLQAVRLGAEGLDAATALDRIADGSGPYRLVGKEMRAARAAASGDLAAAHKELNEIVADPTVTQAMQQRAVALLLATGGEIAVPGTGDG